MKQFRYGIDKLTPGIVINIAEGKTKGVLSEKAEIKIRKSFENVIEILKMEKAVYGINTGFGSLCGTKISNKDTAKLQYNILKSHACEIGRASCRERV